MNKSYSKLTSGRLLWADAIRVIAIFLVVYVHQLYLLPSLTFSTLIFWTPQLYSQIGVPLFVLISGALLLPKDESLHVFFSKRIKAVLFPWIFWISIYSLIGFVFYEEGFPSFKALIRFEYQMFFSRFWFLPMIFGLYLLTPLMRVVVRSATKEILVYTVGIWTATIVCFPFLPVLFGQAMVSDTSLSYSILQYSGLFLLGYLLVNKFIWNISSKIWIGIFLFSMIATYTVTFVDSLAVYPIIDRTFSRIFSPTFLPGVLAVFMLCYRYFKNIKYVNPQVAWLLQEASKSVLGIYLVHELVQDGLLVLFPTVNSFFDMVSPLLGIPLRAAVVFCISFVIIFYMRKLPFLRPFA